MNTYKDHTDKRFYHNNISISDWQKLGYSIEELRKISVGRNARVSYLTHDGKRDPLL